MEGYISLSRKEKYQHFFYLLLLAAIGTVLLYFVFLKHYSSPFSNSIAYEMQIMEQKNDFEKLQTDIQPFLEKTFNKIAALPTSALQPFAEADIKSSINQIANASANDKVQDTRKESYLQIAMFYKLYFEDKKLTGKKADNIALFEKQFTECSIGFKDKEQQLAQKKAAIAARNN
jgi:hypothetical protein